MFGGTRYERLVTTKDLIIFLGRDVTIVQGGNDRTVREHWFSFAVSLDCSVVARNDSKAVKVAFFVSHGDQSPVAVSRGNFSYEGRRGLLSRRSVSRCPRREGNKPTSVATAINKGASRFIVMPPVRWAKLFRMKEPSGEGAKSKKT